MSRSRPSRPRLALALAAGLWLCACVFAAVAAPSPPAVPAQVSNAAWEQDMQRFAAQDAATPPPSGGVVFAGSSSIRLWDTLAEDFPQVAVVNRGFGGSEIRDSTWYADRIIIPYAPRQVLIYAGDNDLHSGRSPAQLRDDFLAFVQRLRRELPQVRIGYIANKPSPARIGLLDAQREANALIQAEARRLREVDYIDVFTPMLDASGQPRAELFVADRLHLGPQGYALWREVIAPYLW
jgi:lysophospholipase L1-like esterase